MDPLLVTLRPFGFHWDSTYSADPASQPEPVHLLQAGHHFCRHPHNVTNTASQNNRLVRLLAERTDALVLASATPHNGKAESFAELVRMLDPSAVKPDGELDYEQVKKLVIRRHRHHPEVAAEVGSDWAERQPPQNVLVPATPHEDAIARELEDVWLWPVSDPGEGIPVLAGGACREHRRAAAPAA